MKSRVKSIKITKEETYIIMDATMEDGNEVRASLHGVSHLFLDVDDEEYGYMVEGNYRNIDEFLNHVEGEWDDEEEMEHIGTAKYFWRIGLAVMDVR